MNRTSNHIEEYFTEQEKSKDVITSKELFNADKNVDIKTDINWAEIVVINKIMMHNEYLASRGIKGVYDKFLDNYMRLKISLDRKSRGEFVNINRGNNTDDVIDKFSAFSNIAGVKK
jgi:hypothetical protein